MKLSMIFLSLALTGQVLASQPQLGQESDPVGGDGSRCCKTGACTALKGCNDTQLGAERENLKSTTSGSKPKPRKGSTQAQ